MDTVRDVREKVIVALDFKDLDSAEAMVETLGDDAVYYKVGMELYTAAGDAVIKMLRGAGKKIFLDLKFFDIPNTVRGACRSAAAQGVAMTNVHALGGRAMMQAARQGVSEAGENRPLLIAVTILTSLDEDTLRDQLQIQKSIPFMVRELAAAAGDCGLDGVVASALELPLLRETMGDDFVIVTPGIRPAGADVGDQKRVLGPREAFQRGASFIVVGRPITAADDPGSAFLNIVEQAAG